MFSWFLYMSILIVTASFAYIAQYGNNYSLRLSSRFICFFTMFIPAALRYGTADYLSYYYFSYKVPGMVNEAHHEVLFEIIRDIIYFLNLAGHGFIVSISFITYFILCFMIPRKHIWTILTFYILSTLYFASFITIRQILAVSLLLSALVYYYYGMRKRALLISLCATLIHISSFVMFPFLLLSSIRVRRNIRIVLFTIVVCLFSFISVHDIFTFIGFLMLTFSPLTGYEYSLYSNHIQQGTGLTPLIQCFPSLVIVLFNSEKIEREKKGNFLLNINFFYIMMSIIAWFVGMGRLIGGYNFIPLFSLQILYDSNKKYGKLYHYLFMFLFFALYVKMIQNRNIPGYLEYHSIFNK